MQDSPDPQEILDTIERLLRETVMPQLSGHTAFAVRVATNAIALVRRQIALQPASDERERQRLNALLERDGSLAELNAALCVAIEGGSVTAETPGLRRHLWDTALDKLAVDQPNYAAYRRAISSPVNKSPS